MDVKWILIGSHEDVQWISSNCQVDVEWMSSGCRVDVKWMLSGCWVNVKWMLSGCKVVVEWLSSGCQVDVKWMSSGCLSTVDVKWLSLLSTWHPFDMHWKTTGRPLGPMKIWHPPSKRISPKFINWHRFLIVRVSPLKISGGGSRPMRSLDSRLSTNHRPPFQAYFILWLILKAATVLQFSQSKPDGNWLGLVDSVVCHLTITW